MAFPPLLGAAIEVSGVRSVPLLLLGLAVLCAVLSRWLRANARPRDDRAPQPVPVDGQRGAGPGRA